KSIDSSTNKTPKFVDQQTTAPTASSSKSNITPISSNNTPAAPAAPTSQQFHMPTHQSSPYISYASMVAPDSPTYNPPSKNSNPG
ncbi:4405_t:CDS:1, partial [Paraglomus occultum]